MTLPSVFSAGAVTVVTWMTSTSAAAAVLAAGFSVVALLLTAVAVSAEGPILASEAVVAIMAEDDGG